MEIVGSWPGPVQLFNTGYSLLDPRVYRYTSPDGQVFVVDREDGLKSLTDRAGNVLTMTPAGISSKHPDVPGSEVGIAFERDLEGRITRVVDPEGQAITYEYDASGDLVAVTDREDHTTSFRYLWEPAHYLETIDDPLGRTPIRNEYDETGRLVAHIDAFGHRIDYTHDVVGRQEIVRDRNGDQRVLEYDSRGNVLRETDPKGKVVDRTYDARNNRLTETEPYDPTNPPDPIPTTTYAYDNQDNLLSVEDPLGNRTAYTYNTFRQVLSTTDARGNPTTNAYDAKGNLLSTQDALGNVTAYTYDARGNVLTQTVTVDGVDQVTGYAYDPAGASSGRRTPPGHETTYTYDRTGNRLTQTTTRTTPAGPETLVTTYEYDSNGRLTTHDRPGRDRDGDGVRRPRPPGGEHRQAGPDDRVRLRRDGPSRPERPTPTPPTRSTATTPRAGGRASSDRGGRTTTYDYDSLGRLVKTVYPDASFTENVYDDAGRLVETRDAERNPSVYEYDSAGRRTKVRDALGQRDRLHLRRERKPADGDRRPREHRHLRVRRPQPPHQDPLPARRPGEPVTFTETAYDELGRRVSETDQAGKTTTFEYDALGRLTAVIDALDQRTTYTYDELGNRLTQTDANSHTTSFEYDTLGRQTARILPDGSREEMTYDPAGNLETRTDFMGRLTTYAYDVNNRLLSRTYPNPAENVAFTYTPTGRRLTATDARGTTTYDYDAATASTTLTYPDGRSPELRLRQPGEPHEAHRHPHRSLARLELHLRPA